MYDVSQNFIDQSHSPVQRYALRGYIGNVQITEANVLKKSLSIDMQATKKDFNLGYAYTSELNATFLNVNIPKYSWKGKTINLEIGLKVGNAFEYVPLQSFVINEANITASGVVVKAYDYMTKFDKTFPYTQLTGTIEDVLELICTECDVDLETLTNINKDYHVTLSQENDCETYRDVIYWLAQILGGFATINRDNKLEIRVYGNTSVDTLEPKDRLPGKYGEYVTNYNGVYITAGDTVEYYGAEESGSTLKLGSNPFLQDNRNVRQLVMANVVTMLANVQYVPFKVQIPTAFHYDLADVLILEDGLGDSTKQFCIQSISFKYDGLCTIQGYGDDPTSKVNSKSDKSIQGLLNSVKTNEMAFYELTNAAIINVAPNTKKRVARLKMASKTSTRIQIHIEINLQSEDTDDDDITRAIIEYTASGEVQELHPQETYIDGYHVLHLMYIMAVEANWTDYFVIDISAESGSLLIDRGAVKIFASGLGLVGDGTWDGALDLEDEVPLIDIPTILVKDINDNVSLVLGEPIRIVASDTTSNISINGVQVNSDVTDSTHFGDYLSELTWGDVAEYTWGAVMDNYSWGNPVE